MLTLTINRKSHTTELTDDTPLVYLLRAELALVGTRIGCGLEQCGACVVTADGNPIYSCTTPIGDLAGRDIETVEGLTAEDGTPHPLQTAFLIENAGQCGYCLSGILMRAKALLDRDPSASHEQVCEALDPHLCRCGAHPRILRAVARAAKLMSAG